MLLVKLELLIFILCIRYESPEQSPLKSYLLLDPEDGKGIDFEFLGEAVRRFDEDESVKPAFVTAVEALSQELSGMNVNDDYKPYVTVCLDQLLLQGVSYQFTPAGLAKSCPSRPHCCCHHRVFYIQRISGSCFV